MRRGPKPAKLIDHSFALKELCSYGCNRIAKFINQSGKLMCEENSNRCPMVKHKNSTAIKIAYEDGRLHGWNSDVSKTGTLSSVEKRKIKFEWQMKDAPWEEVPKHKRRIRILFEQDGKCAICNCEPIWNNKQLKFQLDHIQGRQFGDVRSNLRLICPNCHSQTETFGSKNATSDGMSRLKDGARKHATIRKRNNGRWI